MADQYRVTLAKCATYTEMGSGKTWRKNQSQTMTEAQAERYKANPKFLVQKVEPPKKAKAKPAPKAPEGGEGEGDGGEGGGEGDGGEKKPAKKTPTKKAASKSKAS